MINLGRHDGPPPRTYRDLLTMGRSSCGSCVSCHKSVYGGPYGKRDQMFSLGTRANICRECCERKGDEVLGPIAKAERKGRHYARELIKRRGDIEKEGQFYARLAGVSLEFFKQAHAAESAKV